MRKLIALSTSAILAAGTFGIANAQDAAMDTTAFAEAEATMNLETGASVYNDQGEEIGSVDEVIIDAFGNQQAVISVGEFLGLGGKSVLIAGTELSSRAEGGYSVSYTQEQLEAMPAHEG